MNDTESPFELRYRVNTYLTPDDLIVQELYTGSMISRWIMNTREVQIRESLIKMGWKPPPSKPAD